MAKGPLEAMLDESARFDLVNRVIEQLDEEHRPDATLEALAMLLVGAARGNQRKPIAILAASGDATLRASSKSSPWGPRIAFCHTLYGRVLTLLSMKAGDGAPRELDVRYTLTGPDSVTYTSLDGFFETPIIKTIPVRGDDRIGWFKMKNLEPNALLAQFIGIQKLQSSGALNIAGKYFSFSNLNDRGHLIAYCDHGTFSFFDLEGKAITPFEGRKASFRIKRMADALEIKKLYDATVVDEFRDRARRVVEGWWYLRPHHFSETGRKVILQSTSRTPTNCRGHLNLLHFEGGKMKTQFPGDDEFIGQEISLHTRGPHVLYYDEAGMLVKGCTMQSPYLFVRNIEVIDPKLEYMGVRNINLGDAVRLTHNGWRHFFGKENLKAALEYRTRLSFVGLFTHANDFTGSIRFELFSRTQKGEFLHLPITPYRKERIS